MNAIEPPAFHECRVPESWIDEYGHMNMAMYVQACDHATYAFWEHVNDNRSLEERGGAEYAVVETHVRYLSELRLGDCLRVTTQLLGADEKRFCIFHRLLHAEEGYVAATNEVMALGFDLGERGLRPFDEAVRARLAQVLEEHSRLPRPESAGRSIRTPG